MSRSNKAPGARAAWGRLLAMLGLVVLAASCTNTTSDIGVGLPDVNTDTGAFLIDTLTVRSSTVLRDSVPSSNSQYLYVGQYTDPLVGKLTARSAFRLALPGGYAPDPTAICDSITLILKPNAYRYGDTTKTQTLVEVRKLSRDTPISTTKYSYTAPRLTPMGYDSTHTDSLLNRNHVAPRGRARPSIRTLRLPLDKAFGERLLSMGKAGRLSTQDDLDAYLPGLVITPAAGDEGTIIGLSATDAGAVMNLYYHVPTDPTTVITSTFSLADGARHFFQIRANRRVAGIGNLPRTALVPVRSALTGNQTVIQGALGLQTRLEFPYLTNLRQFGNNLTVTSATITASVPTATLTPYVPVPPPLSIYYTDAVNHPTGLYQSGVTYTTGVSTITGIEQGLYSWSVIDYCKAVLANTIPNNGLLLASGTPDVPSRVVIGDSRSTLNKLTFRVYFIRVQ
ncbi:MAG: DUF4270 family protein [Janthinobacterium lividum]